MTDMDNEDRDKFTRDFYEFMENSSKGRSEENKQNTHLGFCVSFYIDDKDGFITRVEMPQDPSGEDLDLSALLLHSIFSGQMEVDAVQALIKLYAQTPDTYENCAHIIKQWRRLKNKDESTPLIKPTDTLRK